MAAKKHVKPDTAITKHPVYSVIVPTIQRTSDKKTRKRSQYTYGMRTKLGVCAFWAALFELNEALPKQKKMTDAEIKRQFLEEFPDRPSSRRLGAVGAVGEVTVNHYRQLYNRGRFTGGVPPTVPSCRYDAKGGRVDGRTGKRPL
jgi:hypothetical protein